MKSKRRHHSSSEESEESDCSDKSSSSSDTESEDSSEQEHRHKKKKKRADSSESESDSDVQKRSKKRKHKKKSKKHGKKKRRGYSEESESGEEPVANHFRLSDGEISPKKKRKHKHKHNKRARSSSSSVVIEKPRVERRLHSVVKGRRASSEENSQPSRTYYQKEYHPSAPGEDFEREREVQRFYRGSSKERRHQYEEQYQYNRERNDRHRYEEQKGPGHYHRRQRQDQPREDTRGFNRYNQYEDRSKRDYDDGRDYRERRGPPETDRYRQREYPDPKREKYREERYSAERVRDGGARDRPVRDERPPASQEVARSRSGSQENRYREKWRKEDGEGSRRRDDRPPRSEDRPPRDEARSRPPPTDDNQLRKRKSRFADASDNKEYSWGKTEVKKEGGKTTGEKEKPNFGLSGKLTADQNTVNGVVIKYTEPEDAKQPKRRWRFYPFKGDKALPILYIHRQSAFLLGRDKKVADIPLEHPSVSKQHAALQYRATPFVRNDGTQGRRVRPYIIDLDSANGTFVNNKRIEPRRYVELLERDVVKFGFSQREYVLLHENSKDDALDDDQQDPGEIGAAVTTTDQIKHEKRIKQEVAEDGE